jgi:hypothetical protein
MAAGEYREPKHELSAACPCNPTRESWSAHSWRAEDYDPNTRRLEPVERKYPSANVGPTIPRS